MWLEKWLFRVSGRNMRRLWPDFEELYIQVMQLIIIISIIILYQRPSKSFICIILIQLNATGMCCGQCPTNIKVLKLHFGDEDPGSDSEETGVREAE